jgi:hypothetical protein
LNGCTRNKSSTYPRQQQPLLYAASYARSVPGQVQCCLILARTTTFLIAIEANLLISYANGQVAGTLHIFILRTAFTAAEAHFLSNQARPE